MLRAIKAHYRLRWIEAMQQAMQNYICRAGVCIIMIMWQL